MDHVEEIKLNGQVIAIIVYDEFKRDGIQFFTPGDFSQQLGYMSHQKGDRIQEHMHLLEAREIKYTQETLFIKSGRVRVDFFDGHNRYFASRDLKRGDVTPLASGGHGFEFLEPTEMFEVKQGPYCGDRDKLRFQGVRDDPGK